MTKADIPALVVAALKPFAEVTDCDIGYDEADEDIFMPMSAYNAKAPLLTVGDLRRARTALAALAALSRTPGEAVAVKPLEWRTEWHGDNDTRLGWTGRDGLGHSVWVSAWKADEWIIGGKVFADLDAAKAAAQADYEQRIRSALHPAPAAPAGEIEAAAVREFEGWLNSHRDADVSSVFHELVARFTAALSASPAPGASETGAKVMRSLTGEEQEMLAETLRYPTGELYPVPDAPGAIALGVEEVRQAILKATEDEEYGKPNGNIIVKGCAAAEYADPEDAAMTFMEGIAAAVLAAMQPALATAERDATERAAKTAERFMPAGKFVDGQFVAGPNTPHAIAAAIRSGEKA